MRFRFENGGRSGVRSVEALRDVLEALGPHEFGWHSGALLVDFAATNDQPGELFRTAEQWHGECLAAITGRKASEFPAVFDLLAHRYWAEAEAMLLARTAPPKRLRRRAPRRPSL